MFKLIANWIGRFFAPGFELLGPTAPERPHPHRLAVLSNGRRLRTRGASG